MATVKSQIAEIRNKRRQEKTAAFEQWLVEQFGRMPKKGDIIMLPDSQAYSISEVGGPFLVDGIEWDYNTPTLTVVCPRDTDKATFYTDALQAINNGANWKNCYARSRLKGARFARPDEIDGSAYEIQVNMDTQGPYNRKKDRWDNEYNETWRFPTHQKAKNHVKQLVKNWKGRAGDISGFTNLYDETGNSNGEWGSIKMIRVRKPGHPFKLKK